jgi:hydrogenase expression/formation protein HypE
VANEGRFIAFVAPEDGAPDHRVPAAAHGDERRCHDGKVVGGTTGQVSCLGSFGVQRIIDMLNGEQLPRIC